MFSGCIASAACRYDLGMQFVRDMARRSSERLGESLRSGVRVVLALATVLIGGVAARAQDAQNENVAHDVRTVLHLAAGLPPSVRRAVLIPSGEAIRRAVGESAKSWASISTLAMPATARSWSHLSSSLGWTDGEAFDALFGGASGLIFIEQHEGLTPIDRRDDARPQVWALIGEASEATEQRVRQRLEFAPRATITGHAVLAMENGDLLVMFIRKPLPPGAGANAGAIATERGFWWVLVPSSVTPTAVGPGVPVPAAIDGVGLAALQSIAPVLAGEPINIALPLASVDAAANNARAPDVGKITRVGHTDAYRTLVKEVTTGALAVVIERLAGWGEFGVLAAHSNADRIEFQGLATWAGATDLATTVPRTPDALLSELTPESGSTLIEVFQGSEDPVQTIGVPPASALVRRAMSECVGSISVMGVHPATDVTRADGQTAWRLLLAQQLCDARPPGVQNASGAPGLDAVMTKLASVFETARVSGPASFAPGRDLKFDDLPAGAARSTLIRPAIGSFYLRLLSDRAPAWWGVQDGWGVGSICAQGGGQRPGGGGAMGDASSIERERAAAEKLSSQIRAALVADGASRVWLSRAMLSVAPVRQAIPIMFGPATPPGALLSAVSGVSWDAWVESNVSALGDAGVPAGVWGAGRAEVHLRLRIQLTSEPASKP